MKNKSIKCNVKLTPPSTTTLYGPGKSPVILLFDNLFKRAVSRNYRNSNSRSCKQIEYKIIAQNNKEGINNKAQKRVGKDGQT